jgi:hypothetical protein
VQGGWRALADKSKALSHHTAAAAAASAAPAGFSEAAAEDQKKTALAPRGRIASAAQQARGRGANLKHARGRGANSKHERAAEGGRGADSASWETEIRADSLPIVCGLPLLAEASGVGKSEDCLLF